MAFCDCQRIRIKSQTCGHSSELTKHCDAAHERANEVGILTMCVTRKPVHATTRFGLCNKLTICLLSRCNGRWTCCECQQVVEDIDTCHNSTDEDDTCSHVLCEDCEAAPPQ
eukprot:TRINITY_DN12248_c0_g1_i1.p1 TRINITY_DN12248_c0_g1~~TRINITY_DN12248_c0_g1_i1.p1  ORF type:complete len:112 (-),score=3.03 TRINITY_DN12248_c0_g1_i1:250-585(-)